MAAPTDARIGRAALRTVAFLGALLLLAVQHFTLADATRERDPDTGLIVAPGFAEVKDNCTVCHSAALITQSRATRDGWLAMIRWMQETQRLWPLGEHEDRIVEYLAENYRPQAAGRRPPLPPELMPAPAR